jgi:PPOX class probable F420-dependent enzyme
VTLADARFLLLTTFRRDGTAVPTPVWAAPIADGLGVWTGADSGKLKRIRRDARVTLAECDRRGTPTGPAVAGRARVLDDAGTARVLAAVRSKYGLLGRLLIALSRLRHGRSGRAGLAITVESATDRDGTERAVDR